MLHSLYSKTNCMFQNVPSVYGLPGLLREDHKAFPSWCFSRAILSALNHPPTILPLASTASVIKSFPECSKTSCCFQRNPSGLCKPPHRALQGFVRCWSTLWQSLDFFYTVKPWSCCLWIGAASALSRVSSECRRGARLGSL